MNTLNASPETLTNALFVGWLNDTYGDLIETGDLTAIHIAEATEDILRLIVAESHSLRMNPASVEYA